VDPLADLRFSPSTEVENWKGLSYVRIRGVRTGWDGASKVKHTPAIGIDPGRNFGIAMVWKDGLEVWWGQMEKADHTTYGVWAYFMAQRLSEMTNLLSVAVEGAAYHSQFGQVGLAEVRFGFYLAFFLAGRFAVQIVAPASVRSKVFGSQKVHAGAVWPTLNDNGADALAIALFAAGYRYGGEDG